MQEVRNALAPLTDWMPPEVRDHLDVEVWWLVFLVASLLALLIVGHLLRGFWRALFRRRRRDIDFDKPLRQVFDECPLPDRPAGERELLAYHVPVRLRSVVIAPGGKDTDVDAEAIESLLERVVPGLGAVAANDLPLIRIWPPQLSHQGFINLFHRCTIKPERDDQPSRWVLVAGRAIIARQPILLGLGLWADEPNTFGRVNLEPQQWLDVLRMRARDETDERCLPRPLFAMRSGLHARLPDQAPLPAARKGGTSDDIELLCGQCHGMVHATYTNGTLATVYPTIADLRRAPELEKYVRWVRKQPATRRTRNKRRRQRI